MISNVIAYSKPFILADTVKIDSTVKVEVQRWVLDRMINEVFGARVCDSAFRKQVALNYIMGIRRDWLDSAYQARAKESENRINADRDKNQALLSCDSAKNIYLAMFKKERRKTVFIIILGSIGIVLTWIVSGAVHTP